MRGVLNIVLPMDVARKAVRIKQVARKGVSALLADRAGLSGPGYEVVYVATSEGKHNKKKTGVSLTEDTWSIVREVAERDGTTAAKVATAMITEMVNNYSEEDLADVSTGKTSVSLSIASDYMVGLGKIEHNTGATVGAILMLALRHHEKGDLPVMFPHPDAAVTRRILRTSIRVRIRASQHEYIHQLAQSKGLSLNKTCAAILEAYIQQEEPHEW